MKKVLCLILCLMMLSSAAAALADGDNTPISRVSIGFTKPEDGTAASAQMPDATVQDDARLNYFAKHWSEDGINFQYYTDSDIIFEAGETYYALVTVEPYAGYSFAADVCCTVTNAVIYSQSLLDGMLHLTLQFTFGEDIDPTRKYMTFFSNVVCKVPATFYTSKDASGNVCYKDTDSDLIMSVSQDSTVSTYKALYSQLTDKYGKVADLTGTNLYGTTIYGVTRQSSGTTRAAFFLISKCKPVQFKFVYKTPEAKAICEEIIKSIQLKIKMATVDRVTVSSGVYQLDHTQKTAVFVKPKDKKAVKISIKDTVAANGQTYRVTAIKANACKGMAGLKTLVIGKNVTSIGSAAFRGCTALQKVSIPAKVASIGANAFYGCKKLVKVTGMEGVKKIEPATFRDCVSLAAISIPAKVASIGANAFYGCKKLAKVSGMKNVKKIDTAAFYGCISLAKVAGMSAVTTIGANAFRSCKALTAFTIGVKVKKIGACAFCGCSRLKTMTIKANLKAGNVGANAFKIAADATVKCPAGKKAEFDKWIYKKGLPKTAKTK